MGWRQFNANQCERAGPRLLYGLLRAQSTRRREVLGIAAFPRPGAFNIAGSNRREIPVPRTRSNGGEPVRWKVGRVVIFQRPHPVERGRREYYI